MFGYAPLRPRSSWGDRSLRLNGERPPRSLRSLRALPARRAPTRKALELQGEGSLSSDDYDELAAARAIAASFAPSPAGHHLSSASRGAVQSYELPNRPITPARVLASPPPAAVPLPGPLLPSITIACAVEPAAVECLPRDFIKRGGRVEYKRKTLLPKDHRKNLERLHFHLDEGRGTAVS